MQDTGTTGPRSDAPTAPVAAEGDVAAGARVAVILPCLNEARSIANVIEAFRVAIPTAIIHVIDNASTDGTREVAEKAGAIVIGEDRRGKGNAVRRALTTIEADIYVIADGDGTYDASRAPELIAVLVRERLDMVVGSRRKASDEAYRAGHEIGNRMINKALKWFFGSEFRDIFSGYRVLSNRYVKSFPALSNGFETETEMAVHSILLRMPVREIPTDYGKREEGSASKLKTYRDGAKIGLTILNLLRHYRPLLFFGWLAAAAMVVSVGLFYPVLAEYLDTGVVPRFPTLIVAIGIAVISVLLGVCGLILDTTIRSQIEVRRLIYLNTPSGRR